jgi:hypothetical protein
VIGAICQAPSRLASTLSRYAITGDRIIRELALLAFGNIWDFVMVEEGGSAIVDFGTATREQMASTSQYRDRL